MLEIKLLSPSDEDAYREFLLSEEESFICAFYASLEYRGFLDSSMKGEPKYLLAFKDGCIEGILPYFQLTDTDYGTVINSLPWFGSHGGCLIRNHSENGVRAALLDAYAQVVGEPQVFSSTMILSHHESGFVSQYRTALGDTLVDTRIGQVSTLPPYSHGPEELLMQIFGQKTRNLVRKSLRQGFKVVVSDEEWAWRFLHESHLEKMESIGSKAKQWDHFLRLRQNIPVHMRQLSLAFDDATPVAALLTLYFNRTVEYFVPVVRENFLSRQPLSFLIFHAMLDAVKKQYRWWNWGGTWISQNSLHHFKAGWGAVDKNYFYLTKISGNAISTIRTKKEDLFHAFPNYYLVPFSAL